MEAKRRAYRAEIFTKEEERETKYGIARLGGREKRERRELIIEGGIILTMSLREYESSRESQKP